MTSSSNEPSPRVAGDAGDQAALAGRIGPRSSLSLDGLPSSSPAPLPPVMPEGTAREMLLEGAARARNMATALGMLTVMLLKYVALRVIGGWLERMLIQALLFVAGKLDALFARLQPHWERWLARAEATRNRLLRASVLLLVKLLRPLEARWRRGLQRAQRHAAEISARSTRSALEVLRVIVTAIAHAVRAGLSRPAVKKLALRLIRVLEEAEREFRKPRR